MFLRSGLGRLLVVAMLLFAALPVAAPAGLAAPATVCDTLSARVRGLASSLKVRAQDFADVAIAFLSRNGRYAGQTVQGSPGSGLSFKLGNKIGSGWYGVIYELERVEVADGVDPALYPDMIGENGLPPRPLIVKLPNPVAWPTFFISSPWRKAIASEAAETAQINDAFQALAQEPISGSTIAYTGTGQIPLLVKPKITNAVGVATLATRQKQLTPLQVDALRRLFNRCDVVRTEAGIAIDLKPKNLIWNEGLGEWQMYEVTLLQGPISVASDGFEAFLVAMNTALRQP